MYNYRTTSNRGHRVAAKVWGPEMSGLWASKLEIHCSERVISWRVAPSLMRGQLANRRLGPDTSARKAPSTYAAEPRSKVSHVDSGGWEKWMGNWCAVMVQVKNPKTDGWGENQREIQSRNCLDPEKDYPPQSSATAVPLAMPIPITIFPN